MVVAAEKALQIRPGHPGAAFNLALAHALDGKARSSIDVLVHLAARGVDFGVDDMDEFLGVRQLPQWNRYRTAIEALRKPHGNAEVVLRVDDGRFVPEGIAVDDAGRIYLGSIRQGLILRDGNVLSDRQGHWSVFGMRFHEDGSLWFASAAVPQLEDVGQDLGKTGLFRIDVDTGAISRAAILPRNADQQVIGDLIIVGDTIYATDSLTGAVYRYDIEADEFSTLVEAGKLVSPQGLVCGPDADALYVADYVTGLHIVGLSADGLRLSQPEILAANLPEFDEPTLGVIRGDDFYFVANSHWNRFDRENRLPDGLSGPIVLKIRLPAD